MHSASFPLEPCSEHCPARIREALDLVAGKWSVPIYIALHQAEAPLRYATLQKLVGAITPKELARHLRALQEAGLIVRRVFPTSPPSVDYELTELGRSLYPSLASLAAWASRFGPRLASHREPAAPPVERLIPYRN